MLTCIYKISIIRLIVDYILIVNLHEDINIILILFSINVIEFKKASLVLNLEIHSEDFSKIC